ncbi:MAG: hypothetical protein LBK52_02995 [Deltaproteobacteria bacterium]|jgi:hypothetical protein|nr:hypothetical protein [Deltaproteobacteria bacterium]
MFKYKSASLLLLGLLVFFWPAGPAWSLPDDEVQALVRSDYTFRQAEERILKVWGDLPPEFRSSIRQEQIQWIKSDRDREARALMMRGRSKAEAYAIVTNERSDYLENRAYNGGEISIRKRDNSGY